MAGTFQFILNGQSVSVSNTSPNTTVLEFLRDSGLTGAKEGCAEGDCGACSIAIVEKDSSGKTCYRSINSCLVPVCLLAGREVVSVEGVGCGGAENTHPAENSRTRHLVPYNKLHPVQRTMAEGHGSQCGYCTPGFIMSLFEGYYRGDIQKPDQLDDQLCGNLCRCTGYRPIRDAAVAAFAERHKTNGSDPFSERLRKDAPALDQVAYERSGERFFRPASLNLGSKSPSGTKSSRRWFPLNPSPSLTKSVSPIPNGT